MNPINSFLATVDKVFPTNTDFLPYEKNDNKPDSDTGDNTSVYNDNRNFYNKDARMYGAITYRYEDTINIEDYAFPFDKNNFTFPIKGETVTILSIDNQKFWLPYTNTPYSNYRRNYITYEASKAKMEYSSAGPKIYYHFHYLKIFLNYYAMLFHHRLFDKYFQLHLHSMFHRW